jgi:hypothetical protein
LGFGPAVGDSSLSGSCLGFGLDVIWFWCVVGGAAGLGSGFGCGSVSAEEVRCWVAMAAVCCEIFGSDGY